MKKATVLVVSTLIMISLICGYGVVNVDTLTTLSTTKKQSKTTTKKETTTTTTETKKIICIDPGHQAKGNNDLEQVGPGSSTTKKKVSYGAQGISSGVAESQLNLTVGLKLKKELENRGYTVIMTRESQDVDISNKERAEIANKNNADAYIRIHADGSENKSVHGFSVLQPSVNNPYIEQSVIQKSRTLSAAIVKTYAVATGAKQNGSGGSGLSDRDDLTGFNWCKVPSTLVEMGYLSNAEEDEKLQTAAYQTKIVQGIANGIDNYFGEE